MRCPACHVWVPAGETHMHFGREVHPLNGVVPGCKCWQCEGNRRVVATYDPGSCCNGSREGCSYCQE